MYYRSILLTALLFCFFSSYAQDSTVRVIAPGVKLHTIKKPTIPMSIRILEIDRKNPAVRIKNAVAHDTLGKGFEKTSSMAARSYKKDEIVVGAINGDFFGISDPTNPYIHLTSSMIKDHEFVFGKKTNYTCFGSGLGNAPVTDTLSFQGNILTKNNLSYTIDGVNIQPSTTNLVVYNHYIGKNSKTDNTSTEVGIRFINGIENNKPMQAVVETKQHLTGNMLISGDTYVLSGRGDAGIFINTNINIGDTITLMLGNLDVLGSIENMIGGRPKLLTNGVRPATFTGMEDLPATNTDNVNPRTAVGFSKDSSKIYFVAVDGRQQTVSAGMTDAQLADYMKGIGCYQAVNLDGGGSTTLVARDTIRNSPSDAAGERPVGNALMVVAKIDPAKFTSTFTLTPDPLITDQYVPTAINVLGTDTFGYKFPLAAENLTWQITGVTGYVDENGMFTGYTAGNGTITATLKNISKSISVIVKPNAQHLNTPKITRGPYLQKLNTSSITIRWRTDSAISSQIAYGLNPSKLDQTKTMEGKRTEHIVEITGLTPYTTYYYNIGYGDLILQGDANNNFKTMPLPGTTDQYTFWVAGDCGNNSTNQQNVLSAYNAYIGSKTTNAWLLLGDNAYNSGTDAEFTTNFFNIYQGSIMKHAPLFPAPGNHDYANAAARQDDHAIPYYSMFDVPTQGESGGVASNTEAFYSYDYGNVHFLSLDSYGEESNLRLYDTLGRQVEWIKKDLDANKQKWTIAYWHHPPYTMGSHNSDTETELVKMRTNFIRILERYGVDLILCGHSHSYERSKLMQGHYGAESTFDSLKYNLSQSNGRYNGTANSCTYLKDSVHSLTGTVYVVSGSAGQLGGQQSSFPHNALPYADVTHGGSSIIEVDGSRLDLKWLCTDGVIRDQFTIIKDASKVKNYNINVGDSLTLTASWKGAYNWTHSGQSSRSVVVKPKNDTTYIVQDQFQCVSDTFHVKVSVPHISIQALSASAYCVNTEVEIKFNVEGSLQSDNMFTAQISDATGSFTNPTDIGSLKGKNSGSIFATLPVKPEGNNYRIRIITSHPVINNVSDYTTYFSLHPDKPHVLLNSSDGNKTICKGSSVSFTASGADSYQFFADGIAKTAMSNISTFNIPNWNGEKKIMVKGLNVCGSDSMVITMNTIEKPHVSLISDALNNKVCKGDALKLTASGSDKYEFFVDGVSQGAISNNNSLQISDLQKNTKIAVQSTNECGTDSAIVQIEVIDLPQLSLLSNVKDNKIWEGDTIIFTAKGADEYEFFVNTISQGTASSSNIFTTHTLTDGDQVSVKGITTEGCFAVSDPLTIQVDKRVIGMNTSIAGNYGISVYPNPLSGQEILSAGCVLSKEGSLKIDLLDMKGSLISTLFDKRLMPAGINKVDLATSTLNLQAGIYFIRIISNEYTAIRKINYQLQ